jgi:hypothetical protein
VGGYGDAKDPVEHQAAQQHAAGFQLDRLVGTKTAFVVDDRADAAQPCRHDGV